jgi:UV DNA damage endonuclease
MKLGYPVVSYTLQEKGITPYRSLEESENRSETYLQNLKDLKFLLQWNEEQGIKFYRVSNHFAPTDIEKISESPEILEAFKEVGDFATAHSHRLSFHCSHYAVLASPKDWVRRMSRLEIEAESKFFDLLGFSPSHWNKINIHIGGAYGNREETVKKWIKEWEKLSDSAKSRLVVENDDRPSLYSVDFLYKHLHSEIGIPITFDSFHHNFCNIGEDKETAAKMAASTWKTAEPCFHFASSKNLNETSAVATAHADWIYEEVTDWGTGAWTMVESNGRDLAVLNYLAEEVKKNDQSLMLS